VSPRLRLAAVALALAAAACGDSLPPRPPSAPQPPEGWQRVPYPPPPVLVQALGPTPRPDAVWVDGHWEWQRRQWEWTPGRWVRVQPGERYAKPAYARTSDGALLYVPGRWVVNGKAKAGPTTPEGGGSAVPCPCDPPEAEASLREGTTTR
jgi:hypothetical protein